MKLIIAGTRTFTDYDFLKRKLKTLVNITDVKEVVSGCCGGVDSLGEWWALENNIKIQKFPANWNKYKKRAGPIRNKQMAQYGDALIVFWDGKSRGSNNMIEQMKNVNKPTKIVLI